VKVAEVVECLHPTHAQSLDLPVSTLEPLNGSTIRIRVCRIWLVLFEYEYIRVHISIVSEWHVFMEAPGRDRVARPRHGASRKGHLGRRLTAGVGWGAGCWRERRRAVSRSCVGRVREGGPKQLVLSHERAGSRLTRGVSARM